MLAVGRAPIIFQNDWFCTRIFNFSNLRFFSIARNVRKKERKNVKLFAEKNITKIFRLRNIQIPHLNKMKTKTITVSGVCCVSLLRVYACVSCFISVFCLSTCICVYLPVQGPLRECLRARHFRASLLLHLHLCAFLMYLAR